MPVLVPKNILKIMKMNADPFSCGNFILLFLGMAHNKKKHKK